jgi:hypothetical protein
MFAMFDRTTGAQLLRASQVICLIICQGYPGSINLYPLIRDETPFTAYTQQTNLLPIVAQFMSVALMPRLCSILPTILRKILGP